MITLPGLTEQETAMLIPPDTLLLGYMGSIAHGTHIPPEHEDSIDDLDIMGFCVAGERVYFGLERFEQRDIQYKEWDSVVYEIRKFFRLLLQQNPNVLGLLWLESDSYIHVSEEGRMLLEARDLFTSKEAYHSFSGYASGQLKRMTHLEFRGFMGAKRKALVERFGYDCKNAAHLIRLLRMGIEYLNDGRLRVFRHDAEELKAIKSGAWSLEKVKEKAEELFAMSREAYEHSPLPDAPDREKAEQLLVQIIRHRLC